MRGLATGSLPGVKLVAIGLEDKKQIVSEVNEAATSALKKLDQFNLKFIQPTTEKRVLFLQSMLAVREETAERSNSDSDDDSGSMAA